MVKAAGKSQPAERPSGHGTLEEAFACYQSELLGLLYHMLGNMEDARDAYQETFVKCWRHRGQVESVQNLKAWIFRIALNTGRDMRQTAYRRHRRALPDDEADVACHRSSPEAEVEYNEQVTLIRTAVSQLRSEEKEVFLLRQNGEMTYEEIAEALHIPSGTVKTRMRMALTKLRATLAGAT
ncbi:MAG TPA: RNA polymerase sigma factor [Candidatus Anammoximicrobium sp.]|nr:RNA polymerase sigma factor [Candidatus Anammoximicrobium sp.]